ncbi:hypothetical protein QAD02_004355 [Eretmocerus hayati]|uniref:Uncharacterized protein n=1 Tax=Eretmocerus hayati TaxID=131215 RepID=A0ACC2NPS8_9HYME|nr:hypothetical protein QAD02_004355 [Eretmocerus hayati]
MRERGGARPNTGPLRDVLAEPLKKVEFKEGDCKNNSASDDRGCDECDNASTSSIMMMQIRRSSLDSCDRLSLASSRSTNSSLMSGSSEIGTRTLRSLKRGLGKLWRRHRGNASITEYDPTYKVAYLGNVLTGWAKGEYYQRLYLCFVI